MSDGVRVVGGERLAATLARAADDMGDMRDGPDTAVRVVVAAARGIAPRRTGRLAHGIEGRVQRGQVGLGVGGPASVYGGVQEYGWPAHGIRPRRFLRSAAESTRPVWEPAYARELQDILETVKGA